MNTTRSVVTVLALLAAAGCGGGTGNGAATGSGTAAVNSSGGDDGNGNGSATAATAAATPTPVTDRTLVLRHGPMTYVMDTPRNQLEKAGVALEESAFVKQLRSRGLTVTIEADAALDGVALVAGGQELAEVELEVLDGEDAPADLLAKVDAHFGTAP